MSTRALAAIGAVCGVASALACGDLFHSTADLRGQCEIDAASCAVDFCTWTGDQPRQAAEHACAWLGACESPLGQNAFGPCMIAALMAYDCAINPNHRVRGAAHDAWACLASAGTCEAVRKCVVPEGPLRCDPGDFTSCVRDGGTVRVECSDGGAHYENCALWGQACQPQSGGGVCGVSADAAGLSCGAGSAPGSCSSASGSQVAWCGAGAALLGIDCAGNGAGSCGAFPAGAKAWVACVAESDAGAEAGCTPSLAATCSNGVARSCPSQVVETIDCSNLLDSPVACRSGVLDPPFDWTSPCFVSPASCTEDRCDDAGATLVGCARGATFALDCKNAGLNACQMVATTAGSQTHAACTPP